MQTFFDNLKSWAEDIAELLRQLLRGSSIKASDWMGEDSWGELDDSSRQIQFKVLEEYQRFSSVLEILLEKHTKDTIETFQEAKKVILNVIRQEWDQQTYFGNCNRAFDEAKEALNTQIILLKRLYNFSHNRFMVIPDTNALLFNPDLQVWSFDSAGQFTIILMPTVLSELDELKVKGNENVRQKAALLHE